MIEHSKTSYLYKSLDFCLTRGISIDTYIRDNSRQKLVLDKQLPEISTILEGIEERFFRLMTDVIDYCQRRDFAVTNEAPTQEDVLAKRWLEGNIEEWLTDSDSRVNLSLRGRKTPVYQPDKKRFSLGERFALVCKEFFSGQLSKDSMRFLAIDLDYNLDWLILGHGSIARTWYHEVRNYSSSSHYNEVSGEVEFEKLGEARGRQSGTQWSAQDWLWLIGNRLHVGEPLKTPTLPLVTRLVSEWHVSPATPAEPDLLWFVDWFFVYIFREFVAGQKAEGWKQTVFYHLAARRSLVMLLLGGSPQAVTACRGGKTEPIMGIRRLCWLMIMLIKRFGRDALLAYMDMLDQEARGRGLSGFLEVVQRGSWAILTRKRRKSTTMDADAIDVDTSSSSEEGEDESADSSDNSKPLINLRRSKKPWEVPYVADASFLETAENLISGRWVAYPVDSRSKSPDFVDAALRDQIRAQSEATKKSKRTSSKKSAKASSLESAHELLSEVLNEQATPKRRKTNSKITPIEIPADKRTKTKRT